MNNIYDIVYPKKYFCSWSGGKDSTATIILAHMNNEPLDKIIFCEVMFDKRNNISGELPEHINWIYSRAIPQFKRWGYEVDVLKAKKDYLDLFYKVCEKSKYPERIGKHHGFLIGGKCAANRDLKVNPIKEYYKQISDDIVEYLGIAKDETDRLKRNMNKNRISLLDKYNLSEQDAKELCEKYNLLSPIYNSSDRGGCWFCPNRKYNEFAQLKKQHPELWGKLKKLGKEKNLISYGFKYGKTIDEVELKINRILKEGDIIGK